MMLSSLLRLLKVNTSHPELFIFFYWTIYHGFWKCKVWNIFTFYLNLNIHFFSFSRRLFAEHHTVSFWCRIFSSRPKSRNNSILSISKLLFTFVIVRDRTRMKSPLRWLKNIGMVSEKLYRNMLKETESYSLSYSKNSCAYHAPTESIGR